MIDQNDVFQDFVHLLDLERLEDNLYRGESRDLGGKSVFGGQVIGQALVAAARTVPDDKMPHSLHAYFLRPGDMAAPIVYDVDAPRDGRSFVTRRVQGIQHGKVIFTMISSFHKHEKGLEHAAAMPDVPPPEGLTSQSVLRDRWLADTPDVPERLRKAIMRDLAIEFRPVEPWNMFAPGGPKQPQQKIWMRAGGTLPDDPMLHRCVVAYASDFNFIITALMPHAKPFQDQNMVVASLDHALWFHRDFRADDWLLYCMDSPVASDARGLVRGSFYTRDGQLVASVVQEGLIRDTRLADN